MLKKIILFILITITTHTFAQYKTDVLVLGGSASGTAAAIQAARSGVKSMLINSDDILIGNNIPSMDIPAFDTGIWKEWKDSFKKTNDSIPNSDPRKSIENIVLKVKNLQYLKEVKIISIKEKNKKWEVGILRNGKKEQIKAKVLIDASFDPKESAIFQLGILTLKEKNINTVTTYTKAQQQNPYSQFQKLYRTSAAVGFGQDSSSLHFLPIGAFISKEKDNLLIVSPQAGLSGFEISDFKNIALWTNIGQMSGAIAAYGPFFNTTPAKANIRLTQNEMFTFKNILYPVTDISMKSYSWSPIQKIIATELLSLDFKTGKFNPHEHIKADDIKSILSVLYPRSRIWFIENKADVLSINETISLISFIGGKEIYVIERELQNNWKNKYQFKSDYQQEALITKEELAVLLDEYLSPYNVRVDITGKFII
jgi:hypothetical protein